MHRKSKMSKRFLSYLLALVMVMTSFTMPTTVFADEVDDGEIVKAIEAIADEEVVGAIAEEEIVEDLAEENTAEYETEVEEELVGGGSTEHLLKLYVEDRADFWGAPPAIITWDVLTDEAGNNISFQRLSPSSSYGDDRYAYLLSKDDDVSSSTYGWYYIDFHTTTWDCDLGVYWPTGYVDWIAGIKEADVTDVAKIYISAADGFDAINTLTTPPSAHTVADISGYMSSTATEKYGKGADYYSEGWDAFKAAYDTAQGFVDAGSGTDAELNAAYNNLVNAVADLKALRSVVKVHVYSDEFIDLESEEYRVMTWGDKITNGEEKVKKENDDEYDFWFTYNLKILAGAEDPSDGTGYKIATKDWTKAINPGFQNAPGDPATNDDTTYKMITALEGEKEIFMVRSGEYSYTAATTQNDAIKNAVSANAVTKLSELISECESTYVEEDYSKASWKIYSEGLAKAKNEAENPSENYVDTIKEYFALKEAVKELSSKNMAEITVQKVAYADDFMAGADISSFYALSQAGTVFKDEDGNALTEQGFFNYLHDGGMNWARIRVWNDPYDTSGNGYGGGNNDIEKAIAMGKLATKAGMKVLIDFHYSDFWADPSKYKSPKAWAGLTKEEKAEKLYQFTYDSMDKLLKAGVDVGMVQVGNESNHGLAGETDGNATILYGYGCEAVVDAADKYGKTIKRAIHLTDVQNGGGTVTSGLANQVVSNTYPRRSDGEPDYVNYDAVGVSYYPMYKHGDITNLKNVLNAIKNGYGPNGSAVDVFVAETSWANSWDDGDGFANSGPSLEGQNIDMYSISVQGQADQLRDVVNTVNTVDGLGVFYWEPAWIAPYVACYDDYTWNEENYAKNKEAWEKYGIGWAASYSYEYDPTDAGLYYGGVSVDNMGWFDFDGTALPTANIYRYIKEGSSAYEYGKLVGIKKSQSLEVNIGEDVKYPETVIGYLNNGKNVNIPVVWKSADKEKVDVDKVGYYTVNGIATYEKDGNVTEYAVMLSIQVKADNNVLLDNGNFETITSSTTNNVVFKNWLVRCKILASEDKTQSAKDRYIVDNYSKSEINGPQFSINNENVRSGDGALNFWKDSAGLDITATQVIKNLPAGSYTFGGYFEGGSAGEYDKQYAVAYVYASEADYNKDLDEFTALGTNALKRYRASEQFGGWLNWKNPEVSGINVNEGEVLVVGFEFNGTPSGVWGSVDDAYLYGNYKVSIADITGGKVSASNYEPNTNAKVTIVATHDADTQLKSITISSDKKLEGENTNYFDGWTLAEDEKSATKAFANASGAMTTATFKMPESDVQVSAVFDKIFDGNTKVDVKDATVVSIGGKKPAAATFYATGSALKPELVLDYKGYTLKSSDYSATYDNNKSVGTATITINGKGKFNGTKTVEFKIVEDNRNDIKNATITLKEADTATGYYYTGSEIEFLESVKVGDTTLVKNTDYTVTYEKNKAVGTATMYVTGLGKYKGAYTKKIKIVKADISKLGSKLLVNGNKYDTEATDKNKLADVTYVDGKKALKPGVTLMHLATMLKEKKDYSLSFKNNKKVGTATLTIKGKGNYTGSLKYTFEVKQKNISDVTVRVVVDDLVLKASEVAPKVKVTIKDSTKTKETEIKKENYYISKIDSTEYSEADKPKISVSGNHVIEVTGRKNLKGSISINCVVIDKDHYLTKSNVKFGKVYYTGKRIELGNVVLENGKPDVGSMLVKAGSNTLVAGTDYEITEYKNNQKVGKATVYLQGKGAYAGKVTAEFKIGKLKFTDWEKYAALSDKRGYATVSGADMKCKEDTTYGSKHFYTGYAITPEYEDLKAYINGNDAVAINLNKDYNSKFSNNTKPNDFNGDEKRDDDQKSIVTTLKGKGNYSGSVKVKDTFAITQRNIDAFDVSVEPVRFMGIVVKAIPTFTDKTYGVNVYIKPNNYKLTYKYNKNVAGKGTDLTPTVILKPVGVFAKDASEENKEITCKFSIVAGAITLADVKQIKPQSYKDGKAVKPSVKVSVNGKTLKLNKDYIVKYYNNYERYSISSSDSVVDTLNSYYKNNPDEEYDTKVPYAVVTGIGNYTGTAVRVFTIK